MANIYDSSDKLSERDITSAEKTIGLPFPAEYKAFLLQHNGGYPQPDRFRITWPDGNPLAADWATSAMSWFFFIWENDEANLVRANTVTYKGRLPPDMLAIATDAGGNLILLNGGSSEPGKVFIWIKDGAPEEGAVPRADNLGYLAPDFTSFLASLY